MKKTVLDTTDLVQQVVKNYTRGWEYDRLNKARAYEALEFNAGEQWLPQVKAQRIAEGRPVEVSNLTISFTRQVANDIRMAQPAVKVIATGGIGENEPDAKRRELVARKAAEIRQILIRHIENRSSANTVAYAKAADDQVISGYGAWRIDTEYASQTSMLQEIRINPVSDPIGVVWDPESYMPTREDAMWCCVPVDYTHDAFKERFPNMSLSDVSTPYDGFTGVWTDWVTPDTIRVIEYWYKQREKKAFIELDSMLIPAQDDDAQNWVARGGRAVERETDCVYRALVSATEELEKPVKWMGSFIPIIPVFGEETQIKNKRVRWGLVEFIKAPQRMYNYYNAAQIEIVGLQPKSPFIGTEKQFEGFEDQWAEANVSTRPYLTYHPDPLAPGAPQRSQTPVSSQGIADGMLVASNEMKSITGIYDAALGQRSNETSGVAINARKRESDVGTYVYSQNFGRAINHSGRVCLDLMPRVYDTKRTIRVMGLDGKIDPISLNTNPQGAVINDAMLMINDISSGEYDVVLEQGPSYATRRDEMKDAMVSLVQANPALMQIAGDLIAKAQDMPDALVKRMRATVPPDLIKAEEMEEGAEQEQQQPPQIPPEMIQEIEQKVMSGPEFAIKDAQARKAGADAQKAELEFQIAQAQAMQPPQQQVFEQQPMQPDPMQTIQLKAIEKQALGEVDFSFEQRRKKMEREHGQMAALGYEEGDGNGQPTALDGLAQAIMQQGQAMMQQGEAMQAGLQDVGEAMRALAAAQAAPTRIIRDASGRASGAEKVIN